MPDLNKWLGQRDHPLVTTVRAFAAWNRIQDKPTSITVYRGNPAVAIAAQTVRIEFDNNAARMTADTGAAAVKTAVIFGVAGHPTVSDPSVQKDDRVRLSDDGDYRVVAVIETPGEVQASVERIS